MSLPAPDSPEANRLGCKCPSSANHQGAGLIVDGVKEYTIHPECPVHSNPRAWYGRPLPKGKVAGALAVLLMLGLWVPAFAEPAIDQGSPGLAATSDAREICSKVDGQSYSKRHRSGTVERSLHCPKGWQSDHQLPLAAGGADDVRNLHCQPPDKLAEDHLGWEAKDKLDDWAFIQICHKRADPTGIQKLFLAPAEWQDGYCKTFPEECD